MRVIRTGKAGRAIIEERRCFSCCFCHYSDGIGEFLSAYGAEVVQGRRYEVRSKTEVEADLYFFIFMHKDNGVDKGQSVVILIL